MSTENKGFTGPGKTADCAVCSSGWSSELALARAQQEQIADDLTRLIDSANAPIIGIDAQGNVNEWNQTAARITGFSKQEALEQNLVETFITEDFKASVGEVLDKALRGEETSNYEFPLFTKDGERIDVLLNSTTRRDAAGYVVGVVGVGQDITELALARAEQERIANDLTRLIDSANAPIIGIDAQGNVNEWNQTAARITGFAKEEALGHNLVETFITEDFKASVSEVLDKALGGEETSNYEFPLFTKDGERIHLLLNATARRDASEQVVGVVGIGQDITQRYEKEERLRERARLEAIGNVTGGIAHEFNNLLTVVTGNLAMLSPRDELEREIVNDATRAARSGSELVRNLLAFSRRQTLEPGPCNLDRLLEGFQRSVGRALGQAVALEVSVPEERLAAFIDRSQFEAALLNLCINSRDAMTGNGTIRLSAFPSRPQHGDSPLAPAREPKDEDFICVQVADDGSGIEPELLNKVTEPYFTTKAVGEGSGLGLSSVLGFVDQSGGSMRIFSERGVGTTVELFLPRSSPSLADTDVQESGTSRESVPERTRIQILVVDDEPDVRRLAARWLKRSGYAVIEAATGDEALACIEERAGDIDVLFSDIVMPGELDGWTLAEQVSARYPQIGIQLATGYDQARTEYNNRTDKERFPVLFKPYNLTDLSESVERLARQGGEQPGKGRKRAPLSLTPFRGAAAE